VFAQCRNGSNNRTHSRSVEQCCQLAEISAAKRKSGPIKISAARTICGRIFGRLFKKMAETWPNLFWSVLLTKKPSFWAEINYLTHLWIQLFCNFLARSLWKNSLYGRILYAAEFFRKRPNFLVDLAENICQELATLLLNQTYH
jgi:hypothetical protein